MFPEKKEAGNRQEELLSRAYELAITAHQGKNDRRDRDGGAKALSLDGQTPHKG